MNIFIRADSRRFVSIRVPCFESRFCSSSLPSLGLEQLQCVTAPGREAGFGQLLFDIRDPQAKNREIRSVPGLIENRSAKPIAAILDGAHHRVEDLHRDW